jgi:hypothetical protein
LSLIGSIVCLNLYAWMTTWKLIIDMITIIIVHTKTINAYFAGVTLSSFLPNYLINLRLLSRPRDKGYLPWYWFSPTLIRALSIMCFSFSLHPLHPTCGSKLSSLPRTSRPIWLKEQ